MLIEQFVHSQTNGTIGYLHLSNLQEEGLRSLERWIDVECRENGVIIDLRYNGGGYYEATALERIFRTKIGRTMVKSANRGFSISGNIPIKAYFLVNGATQSAGEGLALGARENELINWDKKRGEDILPSRKKSFSDGGVVGVTTVIWSGNPIENNGVEPDIIVLEEDEQLQKAIEILMR